MKNRLASSKLHVLGCLFLENKVKTTIMMSIHSHTPFIPLQGREGGAGIMWASLERASEVDS